MSAFGGLILTNKGRALQAKAQTGIQLNFTRIAVGDGDLSGSSILELNTLKHEVKSLAITKLQVLPGGKATVGSILSNQSLASGFYWREIGVFAQDPTEGEILYCYGNAGVNAEYIAAGGGADIIEKKLDVITLISNAANVTATIEQSLVYATLDYVDDEVAALAGPGRTTETVFQNALDIKTIQGSLIDFVKKSKVSINYYVGKTGNDNNNGLTPATRFLTIQKAIDSLPQVINHTVNIYVSTGSYVEAVTVQGFTGSGSINIYDENGQVQVQNFSFYNNSLYVYLGGNFLVTTNRIAVYRCVFVHLYNISSTFASSSEYGIFNTASRLFIQFCNVSNKSIAIYCSNMGKTVVQDVAGSGNTAAFQCDYGGEIIKKSGNTIAGQNVVFSSGKIVEKSPSSSLVTNGYKIHEDGLIEQWGVITLTGVTPNVTVSGTVTFPMAFPNNLYNVQLTPNASTPEKIHVTPSGVLLSSMTVYANRTDTGALSIYWRAIGN